ncbi:MAG: tRNA 2-thiouridine(34) synthase MnmA [Campylobacteraceae bacterium]|jgi:tRNA-specific 2-thiouridylase|nr:tRNA 2-thiouridine(34) synthase MnmA [Campylobacteraceae bacterium]
MANILVAMSGGVDSTTTAYLLKQSGNHIEGCYLRLHGDDKKHRKNIDMVKRAADFLGIKYHILDLSKEFKNIVYDPFVKAYKDGTTPNPCVLCNKNIKFGALLDFAKSIGMDKLATGHYVRIKDGLIHEATDKTKDQSYFLAQVSPDALPFMIFPLGEKYKKDIKAFALSIPQLEDFSTQKESSEICFVQNTYIEVLQEHMNVLKQGEVLNTKGEVIGTHQGYMHYTIGKRRGFEIKGAHEAHYVTSIDPEKNQIIVGSKDELEIKEFKVECLNMFISKNELEAYVKIRYRSPKLKCKIIINNDGKSARVIMYESASAIAAGQLATFYQGEYVVGSGIISR